MQKKELASYSRTESHGSPVCGAEICDNNFDARNEDSLFKYQRHAKETQEEIQKAMRRKRSKTQNFGYCAQRTSKGQCSRGDSCSFIFSKNKRTKGKAEDPVPIPMEPKGTRKVTEEGGTKGRGPKGTGPSGKSNWLVCYQLQKWQCVVESACDYWHPQECSHHKSKSGFKCVVKCVFKHKGKAGGETLRRNNCQTCGTSKRNDLCIGRRTIDSEENRMICVAMRRDTFVQGKEKEHRWVLFRGDPKTVSIRTPLLVRMCINSGLSSVKKNHELQHGSCTSFFFTRSAGRTKKIRMRFSNQRLQQEPSLGQQSVMKEDNSRLTQAACVHMMSKSDFIHEEKDRDLEIERSVFDY